MAQNRPILETCLAWPFQRSAGDFNMVVEAHGQWHELTLTRAEGVIRMPYFSPVWEQNPHLTDHERKRTQHRAPHRPRVLRSTQPRAKVIV